MHWNIQKIKLATSFTLLTLLSVVAFTPQASAAATVAYTIEPGAVTIAKDATQAFSLYATIAGGNVIGGNFDVNFPSQLQYQSYDSSGSNFSFSFAPSGDTLGSTKVSVSYGTLLPGKAAGKWYIGKVVTKGVTAGSGSVTLTGQDAQDPSEAHLACTVSGASFTVTAPTTTPPPTTTPSPTSTQTTTTTDSSSPSTTSTTSTATIPSATDPTQTTTVPASELVPEPLSEETPAPVPAAAVQPAKATPVAVKVGIGAAGVGVLAAGGFVAVRLLSQRRLAAGLSKHVAGITASHISADPTVVQPNVGNVVVPPAASDPTVFHPTDPTPPTS